MKKAKKAPRSKQYIAMCKNGPFFDTPHQKQGNTVLKNNDEKFME